MGRVAIVGVGVSKFGVRKGVSLRELAFEAFREAMEDAGIEKDEIQAVVTACASDEFAMALQPAAQVQDYLGLNPKPHFRAEAACASGSMAVRSAWMTIQSGLADIVLVNGVEKMTEVSTARATEIMGKGGDSTWEYAFGMSFPGYYAMLATNYLATYRESDRSDLAKVAVKNHYYGTLNPKAHMQKIVTEEQAMSGLMVAYPLRLHDCSLISDGAASIIMVSEKVAKKFDRPVWLTGLGAGSETHDIGRRKSLTSLESACVAAEQAYKMAGISPRDVDVAVVHDCFTIAELIAYEDLGFCGRGEAPMLIRNKETYLGGRIPVNVDGGLKSKGHPVGATGVAMTAEIVKQLRGECGKRQVKGAKTGLSHNVGGSGQFVAVHVYQV
ncbi:MAG: thiolase domain-containing protein [Deltaproteobacteria bacterium]|nr:MAG: thiolase domain-containing protein [Deltaproteobacteria bacterium]